MAEPNNIPEAEDTKTRVTAKISVETPGKGAPQIDLSSAPAAEIRIFPVLLQNGSLTVS